LHCKCQKLLIDAIAA